MRMGACGLFPSHGFGWMCLLFWFGVFFCLCWDEESGVICCISMQCYVGVDGMRMGWHVGLALDLSLFEVGMNFF